MTPHEPQGLAVYVHWPFCEVICPYCDFNVYRNRAVDERAWVEALIRQTERLAARMPNVNLRSIFFGGGTPSLLSGKAVADIIAGVRAIFSAHGFLEISLEANPTSAESARFAEFADAGVNRLSLGIQSLDDAALTFLGRRHSVPQALAALSRAAACFDNHSVDLIYARPGQSARQWRDELKSILELGVPHLSAYQLTIEPGTAFHRQVSAGRWQPLHEDLAEEHFFITQEETQKAGLLAYEISNHARPGYECQHNLTYWTGGAYLGLGPGAHGRMALTSGTGLMATMGHMRPTQWLSSVTSGEDGLAEQTGLSPTQRAEEMLFMGLRLRDGLSLQGLAQEYVVSLADLIDEHALTDLIENGFLCCTDSQLATTPKGRPVLNEIVRRLLSTR